MAGLKILPIRKKSIEKMCTTTQCSNKKQYTEKTKKDMTYPQEDFLTTTTTMVEEKNNKLNKNFFIINDNFV